MRYGYDELLTQIYRSQYDCFSIGRSHMGREILAIKLGSGKTPLIVVGAHHGREFIASQYIMGELEELRLPEDITLYAIPMLNPDGVELSFMADPRWKANARGVDLNRNYPCLFYEKITEQRPCREGFKGYYPASEREVKCLIDFVNGVDPFAALTFHAKGEEIYYADENTPYVTAISKGYAQRLAQLSGYRVMPPSKEPRVYAAGFENWFRMEKRRPCLLIELAPYDKSDVPYPAELWRELTECARGMVGAFAKYSSMNS